MNQTNSQTQRRLHQDAIVEQILQSTISPTDGETDHYAIAVLNQSKEPIFAAEGPLQEIAETVAKLIGTRKIKIPRNINILTFHGKKARSAMKDVAHAPGIITCLTPKGQVSFNPLEVELELPCA